MIECTCGEELELRQLKIRDDGFSHAFGTTHEYRVACPFCGEELDDEVDIKDVIEAHSDY